MKMCIRFLLLLVLIPLSTLVRAESTDAGFQPLSADERGALVAASSEAPALQGYSAGECRPLVDRRTGREVNGTTCTQEFQWCAIGAITGGVFGSFGGAAGAVGGAAVGCGLGYAFALTYE